MNKKYPLRLVALAVAVLLCSAFLLAAAQTSQLSFGHVNVGSSSKATFSGTYVSNFTSPPDLGNITQINVYLASDGTSARAVVYSDRNGAPDILLAESVVTIVPQSQGAWGSFNVSFVGAPNTVYWLGVHLNGAGTYYYSAGINDRAIYSDDSFDVQTNFPPGSLNSAGDLSVYAIYSSSNPPVTTPPEQNNWVQTLLVLLALSGIIIAVVLAVLVLRGRRKKQ